MQPEHLSLGFCRFPFNLMGSATIYKKPLGSRLTVFHTLSLAAPLVTSVYLSYTHTLFVRVSVCLSHCVCVSLSVCLTVTHTLHVPLLRGDVSRCTPLLSLTICSRVVLILSPWNYPFHIPVSALADVLGAGNRVVLKPSESTPGTATLFCELISKTFDPMQVSVYTGGPECAIKLTGLPFDHVSRHSP